VNGKADLSVLDPLLAVIILKQGNRRISVGGTHVDQHLAGIDQGNGRQPGNRMRQPGIFRLDPEREAALAGRACDDDTDHAVTPCFCLCWYLGVALKLALLRIWPYSYPAKRVGIFIRANFKNKLQ